MSDEVTRQAAEIRAERASAVDAETIQRLTEEVHRLKDAGEQLIAECNRVTAERDAALTDKHRLRLELERIRVEAEGLRADLLAHPPEHAARIAELEADLAQVRYERDVALAGSKERQAANAALWEAQQDMQRKADHDQVIIEGLRECLERTEGRLSQAKSRQTPPALVGLLGVIRREAAAAEKMIL